MPPLELGELTPGLSFLLDLGVAGQVAADQGPGPPLLVWHRATHPDDPRSGAFQPPGDFQTDSP